MSKPAHFRDDAKFWRSPLLPGADLLTAEYFAQEFAPHWHESFSIPVIQSGAQTYRYRGARCLAAVGCIAAINPGEVHTGERATEHGWAYRAFYPSVAWMQQLASDMAGTAVGIPWLPDGVIEDQEVAARLALAHHMLEAGNDILAAENALTAGFALLLSRYARNRPVLQSVLPDAARVEMMKAMLSENLAEALSLSDLAQQLGLSAFYAARLFSRTTGMPPHAWRNQLRLNRAQALLKQDLSVAEIASMTGYADQSHFNRHFKRAFGIAPGRWRL